MMAVIMCGGQGTRLRYIHKTEKPLVTINKIPMLEYVFRALSNSHLFKKIYFATSPNTPNTFDYILQYHDTNPILYTSGVSYSQDLSDIINYLNTAIFVLSADLPLLNSTTINYIYLKIKDFQDEFISILLESDYVRNFGIIPSIEIKLNGILCCYSGINIINGINKTGKEKYIIINRKELAINVNTIDDFIVAKNLLSKV